jgi:hypothetical protein
MPHNGFAVIDLRLQDVPFESALILFLACGLIAACSPE